MGGHTTPHFRNDIGVAAIRIGSHAFKCTGASDPYDHPHIFLDMGREDEIVCPYCSTLYKFDASLAAGQAEPADCAYPENETA